MYETGTTCELKSQKQHKSRVGLITVPSRSSFPPKNQPHIVSSMRTHTQTHKVFVDIPKKLPEGVLEPLITSLLSHAIYRGPVASCLAPSENNHIRGWQNFAFSHIWAMLVWQMEGIKDRRSGATSHLYWTTIITVAERKKKKKKNTEANKRTYRILGHVSCLFSTHGCCELLKCRSVDTNRSAAELTVRCSWNTWNAPSRAPSHQSGSLCTRRGGHNGA